MKPDLIQAGINASIQAKQCLRVAEIKTVATELIQCLKAGNKVLLAGNGGSAADAQHIAAEFTGRFLQDRPPLAALALTTDTSALTAIANDYDFSQIFSRQIAALGTPGDVFIAISTSGQSDNLLKAIEIAHKKDIITVGLTGKTGGAIRQAVHHSIHVGHPDTPRIQEAHILALHLLCACVETAYDHATTRP